MSKSRLLPAVTLLIIVVVIAGHMLSSLTSTRSDNETVRVCNERLSAKSKEQRMAANDATAREKALKLADIQIGALKLELANKNADIAKLLSASDAVTNGRARVLDPTITRPHDINSGAISIGAPQTELHDMRGKAREANNYHVGKAQSSISSDGICTDNPYKLSMKETFEELNKASKIWLKNRAHHLLRATDDQYNAHDHQRFFPFESMGTCNDISCIGGKCSADTSKFACGISQLSRLDSCTVYSIGGNNQWQFELDILKKTNCDVHTFDCTGPVERFKKPANNRLHFHHICLGATRSAGQRCDRTMREGQQLCGETWTMADIQTHYSHKQIDLLKLDIEGWEWPIFDQDAALDLNLPMQLLMEVHYCIPGTTRLECFAHDHTAETASDMVRFQSHLLKNGYVVVNRDDNPSCRHCTELTLLRVRC